MALFFTSSSDAGTCGTVLGAGSWSTRKYENSNCSKLAPNFTLVKSYLLPLDAVSILSYSFREIKSHTSCTKSPISTTEQIKEENQKYKTACPVPLVENL